MGIALGWGGESCGRRKGFLRTNESRAVWALVDEVTGLLSQVVNGIGQHKPTYRDRLTTFQRNVELQQFVFVVIRWLTKL